VSMDTVGDVWNVFGFTESARKKLPSSENRQKGTCPDTTQWSSLVRTVQRAAVRVAEILFPGGTEKLLTAVGAKLTNDDLHTNDGDTCRGINSSTELKKLSSAAIAVLNNSRRGSLPRRVARAILVKGLSSKLRKHLRRTDGVNLSGSFFQDHGYKDYRDLVHGNGLSKRKESRCRIPPEKIQSVVKFALEPAHASTLSWGVKTVRLSSSETVQLPSIVRRMQTTDLYERYLQTVDTGFQVGRSTFHSIVSTITKDDPALLCSVDYTTGVLVHDSIETLQEIVDAFTTSTEDKQTMTNWLEVMRNFVKVQYDDHVIIEDDDVPSHGIRHALEVPATSDSRVTKNGHCNACAYVPWCIEQLRRLVRNANVSVDTAKIQDALRVLDDIEHKLVLYQGHRARVVNQQRAIAAVEAELKQKAESGEQPDTALLTMDFKMKFEERSARETSAQHFGKRGMSWHGCNIAYYVKSESQTQDPSTERPAGRVNVYLDQIIEGTNAQSATTAFSLLEAALVWIRKNLPFIKNVVLLSDNAKCYQSNELRSLIAMLNRKSAVKVIRYLFSETQDGKSTFARHSISKHWCRWLQFHFTACYCVLQVWSMLTLPGQCSIFFVL